jgi:rhodanese-related sulfurtransferase
MFNFFGKKQYTDLGPAEFKQALATANNFVLLDVRTQEEFKAGHLAGAKKLDYLSGEFQANLAGLDKEKTYFVYCRSGGRSAGACKALAKAGAAKVYNLDGGYLAWQ